MAKFLDKIPLLEGVMKSLGYTKNVNVNKEVEEDLFKGEGSSEQNIWKMVRKLRDIEKDRKSQYEDVERMMQDSFIQSAVELMVDDATQTHPDKEKTVWIETKEGEESLAEELNNWLIDVVNIEENIWPYAFHIVQDGSLFLKTYYSDENFEEESDKDLGDYFKIVDNALKISELRKYGETVGYFVSGDGEDEDDKLLPPEDYIHFISDRANNRETIKIPNDDGDNLKYKVRYGTSFLEAARSAYRNLRLMEDVLLMSRVVRSAMYRIFQIEVGKSSRKEAMKIINEIKRSIESRETFNKMEDLYNSEKSPIPINANIYSPKRNNQGDIQIDEIGGNVDVKDIIDVDYFRNKLFAALKVPKPFLGFSEELPGSIGNGTALTKLDIRYARTVKRLQSVLKSGIRDMCNFYLKVNEKKNKINKFKVRMSQISTSEQEQRSDELDTKIRMADSLNGLVGRDFEDEIKKREFLIWLIEEIIQLDGFKDIVKSEEEIEQSDDGDDEDDDGFGGF